MQRALHRLPANVYIRTVNAFLRWLHLEGYTGSLHRVAKLTEEQKVLPSFTPQHVHRFIHWKSANPYERRLHTLILLLLDTGLRIEEPPDSTLRKDQIDLDNMLLTVPQQTKQAAGHSNVIGASQAAISTPPKK